MIKQRNHPGRAGIGWRAPIPLSGPPGQLGGSYIEPGDRGGYSRSRPERRAYLLSVAMAGPSQTTAVHSGGASCQVHLPSNLPRESEAVSITTCYRWAPSCKMSSTDSFENDSFKGALTTGKLNQASWPPYGTSLPASRGPRGGPVFGTDDGVLLNLDPGRSVIRPGHQNSLQVRP